MIRNTLILVTLLGILFSCQKEETPDPFLDVTQNQDTVGFVIDNVDPNSFAGIYQNVFKPTCSNVGCHDGTFEPDFRTMESAYNTLLFQEPIKNDGSYPFRVSPGSIGESVLIARMENTISPPMPIQIEPDSDWPEKGAEYIENMKQWIRDGAKDIAGNTPTIEFPQVQLAGAEMKYDTLWLARKGGAIIIPDSTPTPTLYFSFKTGEYSTDDLGEIDIQFSPSLDDFSSAISYQLEKNRPVVGRGWNNDAVEFTHHLPLNPRMQFDTTVTQWFFKIETQLANHPKVSIPTEDGIFYIKNYMSFVWK